MNYVTLFFFGSTCFTRCMGTNRKKIRLFFGRIEETTILFGNFLTFYNSILDNLGILFGLPPVTKIEQN